MAKTPGSADGVRRQAARQPQKFHHDELVAAVCKYFCRGMPVAEIKSTVKEKLGIVLKREDPYRLINFAAQRGWLSYHPPLAYELGDQIQERCKWLKQVRVVRTGVSDDVSVRVAQMLLEHVCSLMEAQPLRAEVHIGFAGGRSLRKAARHFAEMLREPREHLPKKIVFHAIVAGFIVADPLTDPNGFFNYFAGEPALQVQTSFVGLPAPGIVKSAEMADLRTIPYMRESFDCVRDIDIMVTSAGGHWQEGHSSFSTMLSMASPRTVEQLNEAGCIGDMMWRPLGRKGPLEIVTEMRTVTLVELGDLPAFTRRGRAVLLLLGPCGRCGGPKGDILAAVLARPNLITHLVVDSRTAREYLQA